ncbi:hypothetical protein C3Y87_16705 [Carbonactinospora thermoautotrophica]|uniref:VTT domain-containing protein n=1 Tax=Carbonactinospora thermoautotrophica TaxID=1469144 RepID=A0A132N587_9ACTN|nr:VTT domain-containing protein [Carbonactinospora thermoautotrophica]KWX00699.1 hypothetical protein LI90_1722 [Carbonactinospora thermoautotrophica]KWX05319.1 hypothetical protein TH66_03560 [Carbonactinospora thermoautotrophica]MCX9193026.1 hypothetical protein [Carbonactinospora thermoautotrophica]
MDALGRLALTYGFCVGSAVVPALNAEAYLLALGSLADGPLLWLHALAAAVGQMTGKMLFYAIGRGALSLPRLRRKTTARGRWAARIERWQDWARRHAWGPAAVSLLSASVGLPPFALWSALAGTLRMQWWSFLLCGLAGRYARFAVVLAAPGLARWLLGS